MDNISPDIIAKIRAEVERHDGPEYAKELLREIDRLIRLVKAAAPPLEEPRCIGHNSQGPVLGCIDCHAAALDRIRAAPAPPPPDAPEDAPSESISAFDVWESWRFGMNAQSREMTGDRLEWNTLPDHDKKLDEYIAAALMWKLRPSDSARHRLMLAFNAIGWTDVEGLSQGASAPTPELKEVMCNFHRYAIETVCLDCKALRAKKSDAKTT